MRLCNIYNMIYLRCYYCHWVDTSDDELLLPGGIILKVLSKCVGTDMV